MLEFRLAPKYPAFSFSVDLSGTRYTLSWTWNNRAGWWMLDIALADGTPLASGLRVVVRTALPAYRNDARLPPGSIIAFDMSGQARDIESRLELGDRVKVFYFEPDEIPEAESSGSDITVEEVGT